jgi:hypothetical protein
MTYENTDPPRAQCKNYNKHSVILDSKQCKIGRFVREYKSEH